MVGLVKALLVVFLILGLLAHPMLLVPIVLVGVPVAIVTGSIGLWRILWFGGRRAKDGDRR